MFNTILSWFEKKPDTAPQRGPGDEFDLRARADGARMRLQWAEKMAYQIRELGEEYDQLGYSTGGITAQVATASGKPDGAPKMDPVTVEVKDKAGTPLFAARIFWDKAGPRAEVEGLTQAAKDALARVPAERDEPFERMRAAVAAMTPDWEIGASVATVRHGRVIFGSGMDSDTRAQISDSVQQQRQDNERQQRDAAEESAQQATVLQSRTIVGGPLKLKAKN